MKKALLLFLTALLLTAVVVAAVGCRGNEIDTSGKEGTVTEPGNSSSDTPGSTPNTEGIGTGSADSTPVDIPDSTPASSSGGTSDTSHTPVITTEPEEDIPEPEKGTAIKVRYVVNNSYAGTLLGQTEQTLSYGETVSSSVAVTVNLGYKFVGWSDGKTTTTRKGDCPRKDTTYTAVFAYDALELPIVSLFTDSGKDVTDKENYVSGKISISNAPDGFNFEDLAMEIRGRGNYTWNSTFNTDPMYNKRPYRIKLSEKMNLLGQGNGKAKVWTLIANHCDQSLLRNQTMMNFARTLTGIVWEPSASSVEVFLNGEYIGVYMLAEQVQVNSNRINLPEDYESSAEIAFLIQMSGYAVYPDFFCDGNHYEIVNDLSVNNSLANRQISYIQTRIEDCWYTLLDGNKEQILSLIDIDSVIDTYIVHELFKNLDTGWDNFYMFSDVNDKLHFGPCWDFDQCAGNANEGVESYEGLRGSVTNAWYRSFLRLDWFKEMVRDRWDELYSEIQKIPDTIRSYATAGYNSYCRNFEKWKIWGYLINREPDVIRSMHSFSEHYEYFADWMENRAVWLNGYYHSAQFIREKVELNFAGSGSASDPYRITSAEDFYLFTQLILSGDSLQGLHFLQTADIDMTSISYYTGVGAPYEFAGTYDGGGHRIHAVIRGGSDTTFFPYLTGTVMNLMTTGSIENSGILGGIARSVRNGGLVLNCGSTVTLSTASNAGGIVGSNEAGGGSVIGCWFAGKIEAGGGFGPINVYVEGRVKGVFEHNYYVNDFCDAGRLASATIENETALAPAKLPLLHNTLNNSLSAVAKLGGTTANQLCRWEQKDGLPSPVGQ